MFVFFVQIFNSTKYLDHLSDVYSYVAGGRLLFGLVKYIKHFSTYSPKDNPSKKYET